MNRITKKQMIIHMDDIGLCYGANKAAIELFQAGAATSASVMIPCAWAYDFIQWHCLHKQYDVGIHSTVTSEWENDKWRPISTNCKLNSMIDKNGFMVSGLHGEMDFIKTEDFTEEAGAQIITALKWGMTPSHLDNHMWPVICRKMTFHAYLELAKQYKLIPHIPAFSTFDDSRKLLVQKSGFRQVDTDLVIGKSKEAFYKKLDYMKPGLHVLTVHPIIDTQELRAFMPDYEERMMEFKILLEKETRLRIKQNGIELIDWRNAGIKL